MILDVEHVEKVWTFDFVSLVSYLLITKGKFSIEPWYGLEKIAPSVYESMQIY